MKPLLPEPCQTEHKIDSYTQQKYCKVKYYLQLLCPVINSYRQARWGKAPLFTCSSSATCQPTAKPATSGPSFATSTTAVSLASSACRAHRCRLVSYVHFATTARPKRGEQFVCYWLAPDLRAKGSERCSYNNLVQVPRSPRVVLWSTSPRRPWLLCVLLQGLVCERA